MADCLGLTLETVSRELKFLKTKGIISTGGRRHIVVSDVEALRRLSESESA
jgi:CRP-like cAMP-binding protein